MNSNQDLLGKSQSARVAKEGDRVYTPDFDKNGKLVKIYGTLKRNVEYPNVSEWYVAYDDGLDCAVLSFDYIFFEPQTPAAR
jgi:hypothetical protein